MKKVELLAPAGNFDCLKAAVNNGANAVYLGGKNFSARAFANNFDENELIEAVKYAHLKNVKVYVTLNTLLNENEFNNAIKMVDFYYRNNVDALLIQDLGIYYYIKENYPDFEIHCSTQMHVHNLEGIKTAKQLGFKRVVIARESNLQFIKEACKQDIEIETFVHGAICVSYSGQCLMSSYALNRSANKGMCAQCCRHSYKLLNKDFSNIDTETNYLLSPKDMCLINDIPSLIDVGVSSFKIEGRLKSSAYVGYVTKLYRKAIDSYYQNINYQISEDELYNLKVLFNRNFTNDYLFDQENLFGQNTPNHLGVKIGDVFSNSNGYTYIKLNKRLNQFDGIRIQEFGCIVNMLYKDDLLVNHGDINDIVKIKTDTVLKGEVYKTLDYVLENSINNIHEIKMPLNLHITIIENDYVKVKLECNDKNYIYVSDIKAQTAKNAPLTRETIMEHFSKLNDTIYFVNSISAITNNAFLPVKLLNEIRRKAIEEFNKYRLNSFNRNTINRNIKFQNIVYSNNHDNIILENDVAYINNIKYEVNYPINKDSIYTNGDNAIICEIGGLLKPYKHKIAYYTLNCCNSYCYEFLKLLGFDDVILSSELKPLEIQQLRQGYYNRNKQEIEPYRLYEGNRVVMYIKSNPFKKYENCVYLADKNNTYKIVRKDEIIEIKENIYNNNKQMFINKNN